MKRILVIAAVASILAACGGQAHAQAVAQSNVVTGPTSTADIANARFINLKDSTITDTNGVTRAVHLVNETAVTGSEGFKNYIALGAKLYYNPTQATGSDCVASQSVIYWKNGPQSFADGCALNSQIHSQSRR